MSARMYCLAGIGGRIDDVMANTHAAGQILAIDGCPLECARNTLAQAGFTQVEHVRLNDLGLKKGESPVSDERIAQIVDWAGERIGHWVLEGAVQSQPGPSRHGSREEYLEWV